ncbi:MAG: hypothetical protein JNL67_13180 [Planctomycetaceae bacterium]|nr:hypothetical protein [Planctomycetaceae bacterium]
MRLLINHLTRMQPGWICTAGIDLVSGRHIRPVSGHGLPNRLLERFGGPLQLGVIIDLGETEFCGTVPEIEDRRFDPEQIVVVQQHSPTELFRACQDFAEPTLQHIFGDDLEWLHHEPTTWGASWGTAAVEQHRGIRSLGCYWAAQAQLLVVEKEGRRRVRMRFREGDLYFDVPVTDYRLYRDDQTTPNEPLINDLAAGISHQTSTLVSVGLSRAYRNTESQPARHWLQVNNILSP